MAELYNTDEAVIQRYAYLYDCYGDTEAFCKALDSIDLSFDDPAKVFIWKGIFEGVKYLVNKKYEESLAEYDKIEKLIEKGSLLHACFLKERLLSFVELQKTDAETVIRLFDEVIDQYKDRREPFIQLQIAVLMGNKEYTIGDMKNYTKAINICDEIIEKFGNSDNKLIQVSTAVVMNNKALYLKDLNMEEEAFPVLDAVVKKYGGEKDESRLVKQVIRALSLKAYLNFCNGNLEKALSQYNEITGIYEKREGFDVYEELLLDTLSMQAIICSNMHKDKEEYIFYNAIFNEYNNSANVNIQAKVLDNVYLALLSLRIKYRYEELYRTADKAIECFRYSDNLAVQTKLLDIMLKKADILSYQGKLPDGIAVYNDIIDKYKKSADPSVNQKVYKAMREKAESYERQGSISELIQAYNEAIDFLQGLETFDEAELAGVQVEKIDILQCLDMNAEYEENYRAFIKKNCKSKAAGVRRIIVQLMHNRAYDEELRGNISEKKRILEEIIDLFEDDDNIAVLEPLTKSIITLGETLTKEKKWEKAIQVFYKAIKYNYYDNDDIQYNIATALYKRIAALETAGKTKNKLYAMKEFVNLFTPGANEAVKSMVYFVKHKLAKAPS